MKEYLETINLNKNNIYTAHITPENFDFHSHEVIQLTYIIGGTTYLITEDKSYLIPARYFVWIPANLRHKFIHTRKRAISVYNIYSPIIQQDINKPFVSTIGIYQAPNLLIEILKVTTNKIIEPQNNEFTFLQSFFQLLPDFIDKDFSFSLPISNQKSLNTILDFILENLSEALSLNSVAKNFNISERTLSRLFKDQLQLSFLKYVKLARTIKSIELLMEGNLNITEIAFEVGYKSISAFSNAFVEMTNKRPSEFHL